LLAWNERRRSRLTHMQRLFIAIIVSGLLLVAATGLLASFADIRSPASASISLHRPAHPAPRTWDS
jgi:hypothetical protein